MRPTKKKRKLRRRPLERSPNELEKASTLVSQFTRPTARTRSNDGAADSQRSASGSNGTRWRGPPESLVQNPRVRYLVVDRLVMRLSPTEWYEATNTHRV